MSATARQLLDQTNAAILAVTEAIAAGAGTVEYMIGNRLHRKPIRRWSCRRFTGFGPS